MTSRKNWPRDVFLPSEAKGNQSYAMVEISISADGALKVAQDDDLRLFVRRLLPEGFVRHHAAERPNAPERAEEEKFLRGLKVFFAVALALTLFNLIIAEAFFVHPPGYIGWRVDTGWLLWLEALAVFAAVLAGAVFVVMTTNDGPSPPPPPPPPGKQVPALLQQV